MLLIADVRACEWSCKKLQLILYFWAFLILYSSTATAGSASWISGSVPILLAKWLTPEVTPLVGEVFPHWPLFSQTMQLFPKAAYSDSWHAEKNGIIHNFITMPSAKQQSTFWSASDWMALNSGSKSETEWYFSSSWLSARNTFMKKINTISKSGLNKQSFLSTGQLD